MSAEGVFDINSLEVNYNELLLEVTSLREQLEHANSELSSLKYKNQELQKASDLKLKSHSILESQYSALMKSNAELEQRLLAETKNNHSLELEIANETIKYLKTTLEVSEKERNELVQENLSLKSQNDLLLKYKNGNDANGADKNLVDNLSAKCTHLEELYQKLQEMVKPTTKLDNVLQAYEILKEELENSGKKFHEQDRSTYYYKAKSNQLCSLIENKTQDEDRLEIINLWNINSELNKETINTLLSKNEFLNNLLHKKPAVEDPKIEEEEDGN